MVKLYTKKGDQGKTTIYCQVVDKDHPRVAAVGALDELSSLLGVILSLSPDLTILIEIQKDLSEIAAALAVEKSGVGSRLKSQIGKLEKEIDQMWENLPPLQNFILPGGGKVGSLLHLARAVCRRAEREMVYLNQKEKVLPSILIYLNRLSDFLFTLARWVNDKEKHKEKIWA